MICVAQVFFINKHHIAADCRQQTWFATANCTNYTDKFASLNFKVDPFQVDVIVDRVQSWSLPILEAPREIAFELDRKITALAFESLLNIWHPQELINSFKSYLQVSVTLPQVWYGF